jgi:two-component system sensor histidine kinase MprB
MSLRARLTVGTAAALALAIAVGLFAAYVLVRGELRGEIDASLRERAVAFAHAPAAPRLRNTRTPPSLRGARLGGAAGYFQLVRPSGAIDRPPGETVRLPVAGARAVAAGTHVAYFSEATVAGTHLRIYTRRIKGGGAVQIARPLTEIDRALSRIRLLFIALAALAILAAALLGALVARRTLSPVRRLTEDAERIAATGDLASRADERRSDELGRLAQAFNTMLEALAGSVAAQRQLVADASHELRTPLTSARTNLETMQMHGGLSEDARGRMLGDAIDELREMTHLIEELVELARGDAQPLVKEQLRLDELVDELVAIAERRNGTHFIVELQPSTIDAARGPVARAVSNLLDNAVKWNRPGAPIEVSVQGATVTVRDHGPGVDAVDAPHVFDRFYRAAAARSLPGSGLGLAIVRQVAEAHGGAVRVSRARGGGARFELSLAPVAADAQIDLRLVSPVA